MKNDKSDTKKEKDEDHHKKSAQARIQELEAEKTDFENRYKRALADYQNLQKNVQHERSNWIRAANKELIIRFLPILDTLHVASDHSKEQTLQVVLQQFLDILKTEGVIRIETEGKKFDPKTMECIAIEEGEEDMVVEEVRAGYLLHESVLRPAQVKVGRSASS